MADTKITALTAISTVDPAVDVLPIVDVSDTTMAASGTTKKITSNQILGAGGTATLASATITGDLTVRSGNKLILNRADNAISTQLNDAGGGAGFTVNNLNGDGILFKVAGNNVYQIGSAYIQTWYDGAGGTRMTLNSTGLGVGVSPSYKLDVQGADNSIIAQFGGTSRKVNFTTSANGGFANGFFNFVSTSSVGAFSFQNANGTHLIIDSGGNVGIGVTPIERLTVAGTASVGGTGNIGVKFHSGSPVTGNLAWLLSNDSANSNILNLYYYNAGVFSGRAFVVNQSGNFMVRTPSTPPTIPDNEMMVFNLTSNTNLRISVKGTDGTVRTANITLA